MTTGSPAPPAPGAGADERVPAGGKEGIFPTFFFGGFECSTFVWKDGQRKDYVTLTAHDRYINEDYDRVQDLGIGVVREAVRWPFVDKGAGRYDWSSLDPVLEAVNTHGLTAIWDLCHYGFPDDCDPLSDDCRRRFADYCHAVAEYVTARTKGTRFFTPVNEITFLSGAATDMGWMYPFAKGRYDDMKVALCRMDIEGVKAIRSVDPEARMVHVDPIIYEVPEPGHPELEREAEDDTYRKAFEAWDMLSGRLRPELGGTPEILDIVGLNMYHYCQAQLKADQSRAALAPRDPRRKPLSELLRWAWDRYHRPIIIGETSGYQDTRAEWLTMVMEESLKALNEGIDLQGVCLYPCVDIPDWNTGAWAKIGIYDVRDGEACEREPCQAYIEELRRWQRILDHPESVEPDALRQGGAGTVQLYEVWQKAREWGGQMTEGVKQEPAGATA